MSQKILDPASGSRMFYFDKEDERVLFGDIREEEHTLSDGRRLVISPDMKMDFRELPFEDEKFAMVVFDPPHLTSLGKSSWMAKKYGVLDKEDWREDLRQGFSECFRVLRDEGVLIFKWNEYDIMVSEILKLVEHKPIFGHRSGKLSKTHWIVWMKEVK